MLGLAACLLLAWAVSENRRGLRPLPVLGGVALQFALAALLLKAPLFQHVFLWLNRAVLALDAATTAGTSLVFGFLGGGPLPFEELSPGASYVLAFRALPLILVISALTSVLYYWRLLPLVVRAFAWLLNKTLGVGGAVGLGAAANVFLGMIEAPLLVRPYLARMSRGELFVLMTCGMATIAGTMMVLYARMLEGVVPGAMGHILTASLISAPAAITLARIMVPDMAPEEADATAAQGGFAPSGAESTMDAVISGTTDGVRLLVNIVAMLVVLVALVALLNLALGLLPDAAGAPLTLQRMLGWLMAPVMWLIGIPWAEAPAAGALMGTKTVLNELLAYAELARLPAETFSPHSRLILTYALCGFANFGSLGIMLGGIGGLVPERKSEITALGLKSLLSGTLATLMTGAVVSVF